MCKASVWDARHRSETLRAKQGQSWDLSIHTPEFVDLDYTQQGIILSDEREKNLRSVSSIDCYCCEGGGKAGFVHIFLLCAKKLHLLTSFYLCIPIQQLAVKICIL